MTSTTQLKVIKVSGADAAAFLQGQLTNDINQLAGCWQFFGYCSPKGRLLSSGFLWRDTDNFYLAMHAEIVTNIIARLRMYVLRSKVELAELTLVAVIELGNNEFGVYDFKNGEHILRCRSHAIRLTLATPSDAPNLEHKPMSELWDDLLVSEGLPLISPPITEEFVPQMVNLELLGGVSFKKGCYTGQEIVARMHYLGKLKQRMVCLAVSADSPEQLKQIVVGAKLTPVDLPLDGQRAAANYDQTKITSADSTARTKATNSESVGPIAGQVIALSGARSFALAVIRTAYLAQDFELVDVPAVRLKPADLPYSMPELKELERQQ